MLLPDGEYGDDQDLPWNAPVRRPALHDEDEDGTGWLGAERRMLIACQRLMGSLIAFEYEAARYRDEPLACLDFDDAMKSLSRMSARLEREMSQWRTAMSLIENDTQIAPRSEHGRPWRPYLSPHWLLYFAEIAKPGDQAYLPQLLNRLAEEDRRNRAHHDEMASVCGRPTKTGEPCQQIPVFWPGRGRVAACNRHLSAGEKVELGKAWSMVEEAHSCPACRVPAGVPCDETVKLQVLPDGEFPRVRTFAGRMMHNVRLKRGAPAES
ncbi:hypothetical protein [Arthrobacter caoxuetaonis]|uniref:Uncharacterized protein n=1 Tax=Arthrobacter caoxuetaonis TaxID=2886935 RepID=A0A9X1MHF3_9MICC|nr:hypothetical protein [Arthrobacter caoxuetaonis]MCC3299280.1 hypothetical protein [Arthrobacter caoxuetaonis]USQ59226.1 hypothetical protein NF551_16720 [Arthrobacter caoxuetaonis]